MDRALSKKKWIFLFREAMYAFKSRIGFVIHALLVDLCTTPRRLKSMFRKQWSFLDFPFMSGYSFPPAALHFKATVTRSFACLILDWGYLIESLIGENMIKESSLIHVENFGWGLYPSHKLDTEAFHSSPLSMCSFPDSPQIAYDFTFCIFFKFQAIH